MLVFILMHSNITNTFYSDEELKNFTFKHLGKNVKISRFAHLYRTEKMEIHDNCRIDDFCILVGKIIMQGNVYISSYSLISGGDVGIAFEEFSVVTYRCNIFTGTDDYLGSSLTGPTVPAKYKSHKELPIILKRHAIVGANSTILPGVTIEEGTSIGACSLILKDTKPWKVYVGSPAKIISDRSKEMLEKEKQYMDDLKQDKINFNMTRK